MVGYTSTSSQEQPSNPRNKSNDTINKMLSYPIKKYRKNNQHKCKCNATHTTLPILQMCVNF